MPGASVERINLDIGGFTADPYTIFDSVGDEKTVTLWQPAGHIEDLHSLPAPRDMKPKAESFLDRAGGSDLAVAPEWSYDVRWVGEHRDELFAEDSPLFVLGCRPIGDDEMENVVDELREDEEFNVVSEEVPGGPGERFVTPTIVPLRSDALGEADCSTVVIQYKTQPMGEGANPNEAANLATGSQVYQLDPSTGSSVVIWTCSDLLDQSLRNEVSECALGGNIVVHPQCNPSPFHSNWTNFRSRIFENSNDTAYVCANWGRVSADGDISGAQWGYSGVYTNAYEWSSFDGYDSTYEKQGLVGVDRENRAEYLWMVVDDVVSRLSVRRRGSESEPARGERPNPQILDAWTWGDEDERYVGSPDGFDECVCRTCDDCDCNTCSDCLRPTRRDLLPDSPRQAELVSAVVFRQLDVSLIDGIDTRYDVPLAALQNLRADRNERLGHAFVAHGHRRGRGVTERTQHLKETFKNATDEFGSRIEPTDCGPTDLPINAVSETDGDGLDICLSRLDSPTPGNEREWIADVVRWNQHQETRRFKPLVLTVSPGDVSLKRPDELEDVTNADVNPEDVTARNPPVELVEVDR